MLKNKFNNTPLHDAIIATDIFSVKSLLNNGADIEAKNINGNTPLHLATEYSPIGALSESMKLCINELLENNANIRAKNVDGKMPCEVKKVEIAELIAKYDTKALSKRIDELEHAHQELLSILNEIQKQIASSQEEKNNLKKHKVSLY